jgi:hypothetical protein
MFKKIQLKVILAVTWLFLLNAVYKLVVRGFFSDQTTPADFTKLDKRTRFSDKSYRWFFHTSFRRVAREHCPTKLSQSQTVKKTTAFKHVFKLYVAPIILSRYWNFHQSILLPSITPKTEHFVLKHWPDHTSCLVSYIRIQSIAKCCKLVKRPIKNWILCHYSCEVKIFENKPETWRGSE